jgi:hypothetical protein
MSGGHWALLLLVGTVVWFWLGDPPRDIRGFFGQSTYDDQLSNLESHLKRHKVGSTDVWLSKNSFLVEDRVAVFFGYMDDFAACYEVAEVLNSRYPAVGFTCRYAN